MRTLQRVSALLGWVAFSAIGVALVLESTEVIDDAWRDWIARQLDAVASPTLPRWAAALVAVGLAGAAAAVLAAQLTPYRLSSHQSVMVDRAAEGDLVLHSRAIQSALGHLLSDIDGVYDVRVVVERRRLIARIFVEDSTNLNDAEPAIRELIDNELWPHLGIEPRPINLEFLFGRAPARVVN